MKTKETSKQIYITVVTSGLTMLANKVARVLQPNEDIFDACSDLANDVAKENGLNWSNVLVQYFNHYSDEIPAMALKVPNKPNQKQFKQGQKVKCPKGIYSISYFLRNNRQYSYYEWGDKIMIKGVGLYNEEEIEIIDSSKQFKQFDESLFKSYIDKFSDEDKLNALKVLLKTIPDNLLFKDNSIPLSKRY